MSILIFSPYTSTGGGKSVQQGFSEMISLAFVQNVTNLSNLFSAIYYLIRNLNSLDLIFIQSIFNPKSLIIVLISTIMGVREKLVILPRGDRIPISISDVKIKYPLKKYLYWSFFRKIYGNLRFLFSSEAESEYFYATSKIKIKKSIVLADPYTQLEFVYSGRTNIILPKRIVYLGRVDFEKNIKFLIEIYCAGEFYKNNIELSIVGPVSKYMESEINAFFAEIPRNIKARIMFYGEVTDHNEKIGLIKNSIVCLPSYYESFGLVCLEAIEARSYFLATNASYWKNCNEEFGIGLDLDRARWVEEIKRLINQGFCVDSEYRRNYLHTFSPQVLAEKLRQQFFEKNLIKK